MPLSLTPNERYHANQGRRDLLSGLIVQRTYPTRSNSIIRRGRFYYITYVSGYRYYIRECVPTQNGFMPAGVETQTFFTNIDLFHTPTAQYLRAMCGREYARITPARTWPPITSRAPKYRGITNEVIS